MFLTPKAIEAFLAIVEHGSLGRAADVLGLTQPALSRIIKRLETQLEVPVFERGSRGMMLTAYGEALRPYASLLHSESEHAMQEIDAIRGLKRGVVRIGTVASAAVMVLPAVIKSFLARRPHLTIQIIEGVEDKLVEALIANEIDLAIASSIEPDETIVRLTHQKFTDIYSVIAAPEHPAVRSGATSLEELEGYQWVMPPKKAEPRRHFEELVRATGRTPPRIGVETRSIETIKALVARGGFLGWLPEPLFEAERVANWVACVPIEPLAIRRDFYVYRVPRSLTAPAVSELLRELRMFDNVTPEA